MSFSDLKSAPTGKLSWEFRGEELHLRGRLDLQTLEQHRTRLEKELRQFARPRLQVNLQGVEYLDSVGVAFLNLLRVFLPSQVQEVTLVQIPAHLKKVLENFSLPSQKERRGVLRGEWLADFGDQVYRIFQESVPQFFYLMADVFYWSVVDLFHSRHRRKGEFYHQGVLMGANAIPIIGLISLLIGLVLALQSAAQLRQFGANIYVVDLIVISMTREMGPLLTAIIVAGRSGSSIASEIATMVVTEEVDALKTMALNPLRYIVVPKMHAMIVTLPLLTFLADVVGIFGGAIIANIYLDINFSIFFNRMENVLLFRDLLTGFIKSIIFAGLIVLTGSFHGFRVKGGSEGVGRVTTASVVTAIFLVIFADSMLGLLFYFD